MQDRRPHSRRGRDDSTDSRPPQRSGTDVRQFCWEAKPEA